MTTSAAEPITRQPLMLYGMLLPTWLSPLLLLVCLRNDTMSVMLITLAVVAAGSFVYWCVVPTWWNAVGLTLNVGLTALALLMDSLMRGMLSERLLWALCGLLAVVALLLWWSYVTERLPWTLGILAVTNILWAILLVAVVVTAYQQRSFCVQDHCWYWPGQQPTR